MSPSRFTLQVVLCAIILRNYVRRDRKQTLNHVGQRRCRQPPPVTRPLNPCFVEITVVI
jgi:hypothetical protein